MKLKRGLWSTRFGFYLVAIGSACGLGNLWRFPFVVGENGGGAFVLLYWVMALAVGLPLLVGELMLGKHTRRSLMSVAQHLQGPQGNQTHLDNKKRGKMAILQWMGPISVMLTLFVLSYYAVISGWVLHFVMQFLVESISRVESRGDYLESLMSSGMLQVSLASVHIVVVLVVVVRGVQEGVEKWVGNMMPFFIVLLFYLVGKSLSLPTTEQALRFLFYPDFSRLNSSSLISALGHVFFTLSVGFGTMVTFGSYMDHREHVPTAGVRVSITDSLISILAGLLVFPMALLVSPFTLADPTLIFEALPQFFAMSHSSPLMGLGFFLCLYLASLGASIGLLEVVVSNVVDRLPHLGRTRAVILISVVAFAIATIPAFSSSNLSEVRIAGRGLLETIDVVLITWILPLVALGGSVVCAYILPDEAKDAEFQNAQHLNTASLYGAWKWSLKYFIPFVIVLGFVLRFI